jgi:hypothetical protein
MPPYRVLDCPDRQTFPDCILGQFFLKASIRRAQERPSMTSGQRAVSHCPLNTSRQLQQSQRVRDRRPTFPNSHANLVMRAIKFINQLLVRGGFLEWIQVLPLKVFHKRLLKAVDI